MNVFDFQFEGGDGRKLLLDRYRGQPVLLITTASTSQFAPQLRKLQRLWENHRHGGLVVIGIPCRDCGLGEPLADADLAAHYRREFGVRYPLTTRRRVRGRAADPLFAALQESLGPGVLPRGGFCKYLFDRAGGLAAYWAGPVEPDDPLILHQLEQHAGQWIV